jgi:hypothetical protein
MPEADPPLAENTKKQNPFYRLDAKMQMKQFELWFIIRIQQGRLVISCFVNWNLDF